MDPTVISPVMFFFGLGLAAFAVHKALSEEKSGTPDDLIFSGRCKAPSWALMQNLENAISVPKVQGNYPLNRYWLQLQEADYQRGSVSAFLEFVEEVKTKRSFGKTQRKAIIKKYGFIWFVEEVLVCNEIELVISLMWKDLSTGKQSKFEELVIKQIVEMTREIVQRIDTAKKNTGPISAPPPVKSGIAQGQWIGPPPSSGAAPPLSAGASPRRNSAGSRQKSQMAFASMSKVSMAEEEHTRRLIEWPSPQDYHEAVQNPFLCFDDFRLKEGTVETDAMGMPRVSSGAFASVYRFHCRDGDRAVRCFLHPIKDQQYRYKILSKAVRPDLLPWTVGYEYIGEGIRIHTNWYPTLVMDWVEGTPLNIHVSELCYARDTHAIEDIRIKFAELVIGLKSASVAHGDLQHGNILVADNELVLVDYDGMYVPGLNNQASNELGHPNYQHPGRTGSDFNESMDHFSAWIIDSALLCLREDPTLWRYSFDDGESMLFHRHDFIHPGRSALLAHLLDHGSAIVRKRANELSGLFSIGLDQVPLLEYHFSSDGKRKSTDSYSTSSSIQKSAISKQSDTEKKSLPDWLPDIE